MWFIFLVICVVVALAAIIVIAIGKVVFYLIDYAKKAIDKALKEDEDNER